MKLYRAGLVGLPLQCSMFSEIARAPELIGLKGILLDDKLRASLSETGDLFFDRSDIDQLSNALQGQMSVDTLERMEQELSVACRTLQEITDRCDARASAATLEEATSLLRDMGSALRHFVPFAILSKFVPDVLYREYASAGGSDLPRLAGESPGALLTRELLALFTECARAGYSPDRLFDEWPRVPPAITEMIERFCEKNAGFGPLPWEAVGYEDPKYVFGVMKANFGGLEAKELTSSATESQTVDSASVSEDQRALRHAILSWIDFLERETWYVRRAFYRGMVPLLSRLLPHYQAESPELKVADTVFFGIDELLSGGVHIDVARARRASYFGRTEYVREHAVTSDRLAGIFAKFRVPLTTPAGIEELV